MICSHATGSVTSASNGIRKKKIVSQLPGMKYLKTLKIIKTITKDVKLNMISTGHTVHMAVMRLNQLIIAL